MAITVLEQVLGLDLPQREGYSYETSEAYFTAKPSKTIEIFSNRSGDSIGIVSETSSGQYWINPKYGSWRGTFDYVEQAIDRVIANYEAA